MKHHLFLPLVLAFSVASTAHAELGKKCTDQIIGRYDMKTHLWLGGWVGTGTVILLTTNPTAGFVFFGITALAKLSGTLQHDDASNGPTEAEEFYEAVNSGDPTQLKKFENRFRLADQTVDYLNTRLQTDSAPITHEDLYTAIIKLDQTGQLCKSREYFIGKKEFKKRLLGLFVEIGYEPRAQYKKLVQKQLKSLEKMRVEDSREIENIK